MTNDTTAQRRVAMISTHGYVAADPPLGAADTGGQVVYVLELARKLGELGYRVDVWTRRFEGQDEIDIVSPQVRVIRVPCGGEEFIPKERLHEHIDEWSRNALAIIRRHRLDYSFINSHYWDAGLAGRTLADLLAIPHLHTPHSLGIWKQREMERDFPEDRETFEERYNFSTRIAAEREIYASAAMVIATTPQQEGMLVEEYGVAPTSMKMIPPGYDDTRFFPVGRATREGIRERLGFRGPTILALGRLARNKGYDLLIDGFARVAERIDDARLHLAIGGEMMGESEAAILDELRNQTSRLGLDERITFGSFIEDADLADYYRAADLFVLSSRYEPFGMTAIEAMACGTPTVVTTNGGLWRALTYGRHALFADPFDADDLGITMTKALRFSRLAARLSRMGAHRARGLFTWTGIAQQLIAAVELADDVEEQMEEGMIEWAEPWLEGE